MTINDWSVRMAVLCGLGVLGVAGASYARDPKPGFSKATVANTAFDIEPNATAATGLPAHGLLNGLNGSVIEVYDDATLVEIHANDQAMLKARGRSKYVPVAIREDMDTISLNGRTLDVRGGPGAIPDGETPDPPYQDDEQGTWLIQFVGPIKTVWLEEVQAAGVVLVQTVPTHAYIAGARPSMIARVKQLPQIQWTSQLHRFLKPSVGSRTEETLELWIELAETDETDDAVAELAALAVGSVDSAPWSASERRVQGVFRSSDFDLILAHPLVWAIAERPVVEFSDERATLGVTDMVPEGGAVPGRYLKWLNDICSQCTDLANDGFYIGIADTGVDGGSHAASGFPSEPPSSGLRRAEFLPASRIKWGSSFAPIPTAATPPSAWTNCQASCPDSTDSKHDTYGHGTLVAGIAAGSPASGAAVDSGGFLWGLGVAPSAGILVTKIMPRRLLYQDRADAIPVQTITRDARRADVPDADDPPNLRVPAYSQNFSLNQYVDTSKSAAGQCATMYDGLYSMLSRDFDLAVRDADGIAQGAQPITITVSSGNLDQQVPAPSVQCGLRGSDLTLPPATAKNVISVGGGENVRPDSWLCAGARSDSYANLAFNAKRGTGAIGWYKPDLIAVSANIASLLTSDSTSSGIACNTSNPPEPYRGGTGTSFAAPVGAAAAVLASRRYSETPGAASPALVKAMLIAGSKSMIGGKDRVRVITWSPMEFPPGQLVVPRVPNGQHYELISNDPINGTPDLSEPVWPAPGQTVQHQYSDRARATWLGKGAETQITALPNAQQGFGRIFLADMLSAYPARVYLNEEPLAAMAAWTGDFTVHDPSLPVRIALAWTDLPGTVQVGGSLNASYKALQNDLDLTVEGRTPGSCTGRYFGNRVNSTEDSAWYQPCDQAPATFDDRNNVEVIRFVASGGRGDTSFRVKVASKTGQPQPFSLVVWNAYSGTAPPPTPSNLAAVPSSASAVTLTWSASPNTTYEVQRSGGVNDPYVTIAEHVTTPYIDNGALPVTTYLYRVRAKNLNQVAVSDWIYDHATTVLFTDPFITPGLTIVKEAHIIELRQAVGALRVAGGLGGTSWTEDPLPVAVRTVHVTQLRTRLDEARSALGLSTVTFTDGSLLPEVSVIKAVHIQQLREGLE